METVDSRQKQLNPHEIIAIAVQQQNLENLNPAAAMLAIAQESAEKTLDMKQFGNTLFMTHRGKGKHKDQAAVRPINVDIAPNLIRNFEAYFRYIHRKGVRRLQGKFNYAPYANMVKVMLRRIQVEEAGKNVSVRLARTQSGAYVVQIDLGEELY